ncbi:MAG: ribonuclease E/G, partial [Lachnospiraceae bacterium]|nr:ribonuclease E/G [Lachnospiraceae bacterium]
DIMYLQSLGLSVIVTDNEEIRSILNSKFDSLSGPVSVSDRVSLRFYEDKLVGLCNLYSFNAKISEALSKKVYLKSGAYITIEHTESLYAVDVNSASNDKKGDREETFLSVNKEAAVEIARQLILRNMSGMIIIDFINMSRDISYDELEKTIRDAISSDREMTRFIGFTALKLCELMRSRSGRSLYSALRGSK